MAAEAIATMRADFPIFGGATKRFCRPRIMTPSQSQGVGETSSFDPPLLGSGTPTFRPDACAR